MANVWNFPSNNFGTVTGIGEAGIETFKGTPYRSLAREICQNSMDARKDFKKPVIIEFASFSIENNEIPDYLRLQEAINLCFKFWTEQNNKKTIDFFKNAKKVIEKNKINVLRISDYNTTGLQGSDKEFNTPWQNLVKAAGVSDKSGSAGGSFGIGKSAPFACSDLRTLFYATKDVDGLSAFQGIARLVSFREKGLFNREKDSITAGTGYYSSDKRNNPLRECKSIDPKYKRLECGTDIFVVGFKKGSDWKSEIITSILEEFLLAIYNNEIIVKIDEIEINAKNLDKIVETYKETAKTAYNYYQVLVDNNALIVEHEFPDLGTIELRVLVKQGLHRKAMMCRRNGMKIFDKGNISGTVQFAAICLLKDEKINSYFREMENPQHDAWEPERHSSKTKAKNNLSMLYRFVKNTVLDIGKKTTVDEVDVEGMGEFFADSDYIDTNNESKDETISSITSDIELSVSELSGNQIGYEYTIHGDKNFTEELDDGYDKAYGQNGSKDKHDDGHNQSNIGTGFGSGEGDNPGTNGIGSNPYLLDFTNLDDKISKSHIDTMAVRLFLSDKKSNMYTLTFIPKKNSEKGFLQISLAGEQKNVEANIISARDLLTDIPLKCIDNRIFLNNIEYKKKNKITFSLKYAEECSLEVKLYGYSS